VKYIADTHLLLWAALSPQRLSKRAAFFLEAEKTDVFFSTASVWEPAVKFARGKKDFTVPPSAFRSGVLTMGYKELLITSEHAIAVGNLPNHHGDPFDRMLVAQAVVEGFALLTADKVLSRYPSTMRV
jgi:PIN domain nuclease of toxin-antitoxin system